MDKYLELGQIVNVKGLKGEVKANVFTDDKTKFEKFKSVFLKKKDSIQEYEIEKIGYQKNQIIIKFKNIDNIDDAEKLRNSYILVDRKNLDPLPEGVYYIADLIGLDVYTEDGDFIGRVDDIYNTGSNDIYVIKNDDGTQKVLPGIKDVIKKIDIENRKIIVNLIKGL